MNDVPVCTYMTPNPHTVGRDRTLAAAQATMRKHHIHHLPVLDGGVLVGIVSDRDLHVVEALRDVDPEKTLVEDAMTPEPYLVSADASLSEVVATMAEKKYGAAVVVDGGNVVGVFTAVDGLRALVKLLRARDATDQKDWSTLVAQPHGRAPGATVTRRGAQ